MPISERERTAIANINGWRNTAPVQFAEELASLSLETKRIADPYSYSITSDGELFSPTDHCLVKNTVDDKTSHLGKLEYEAVVALEEWAAKSKEGVGIWISSPYPGVYNKAAIVISEIEYQNGSKTLFNRKIVLDSFDEEKCMKLAWNLTGFSRNKPIFRNSDEIRAEILILDSQGKPWVDILEKLIDAPKVWTMIRNGEDKQYKKEALRQATMVQKQFFTDPRLSYSDEARMAVMQMLGSESGSCPPRSGSRGRTAFQTVAGSSLTIGSSGSFAESDEDGSLEFECHKCHKTNDRPRNGRRPSCKWCGVKFGGC
ncbi:hypothetical protein A3I48_01395 [Candidatus Daviesbacteria bacterium RIFCSPLOWO2_02_FULL_36_7]|uniref:Uncharacterized protein n=1 Tax=Candidatus Daviesbacteria bacterium RIFCSPLOWO2_02_FULL_36_7 TaxID=1797792 RepID=A0A1F5MIA9_9BACT|nr:MAG: hypothetical protein A3I48_01395 [Candidatus Daviesbacteria bacterium RIFCSPLOWO2_02_FULL_36_7]